MALPNFAPRHSRESGCSDVRGAAFAVRAPAPLSRVNKKMTIP